MSDHPTSPPPSERRVAAAAETLISAGGEPAPFRLIVAAGLAAHGIDGAKAVRDAIGAIRAALAAADSEGAPPCPTA